MSRRGPRQAVSRWAGLELTRPSRGHIERVELNPPGQYADDRPLSARQRLWQCQVPFFDIAAWVLDLARLVPGMRVLDAGCGNGVYLRALRERRVNALGCDLSPGMLRVTAHLAVINADVTALPVRDDAFDVVFAAHLLDLVPDRRAAVRELRRVLAPGVPVSRSPPASSTCGRCVSWSGGPPRPARLAGGCGHRPDPRSPWRMRRPSWAWPSRR
jgi:SAM-dependent methyltransferase